MNQLSSVCSIIIAIHCMIVIANEHSNLFSAQSCDRSRRIFTAAQGEFKDGPTGFNYTQVSPNPNVHCYDFLLIELV